MRLLPSVALLAAAAQCIPPRDGAFPREGDAVLGLSSGAVCLSLGSGCCTVGVEAAESGPELGAVAATAAIPGSAAQAGFGRSDFVAVGLELSPCTSHQLPALLSDPLQPG